MRDDRLVPMIASIVVLACCAAPRPLAVGQENLSSFHAYYEADGEDRSAVPTVDFFDSQVKYSMSNLSEQERLKSEFGAVFVTIKTPNYNFLDFRSHIMPLFGINSKVSSFREKNFNCMVSELTDGQKSLRCTSDSGRVYRSTYDHIRGVTSFEWSCGASSFKQCRYLLKSDIGILAPGLR